MSPQMRTALDERLRLMESRAVALAANAVEAKESWLDRMGTPPTTEAAHGRWLIEVKTVAAYRDRYRVDGPRAREPRTEAHQRDAAQARQAIDRARRIAERSDAHLSGGAQTVRLQGRGVG
jgi:hypothetical protein